MYTRLCRIVACLLVGSALLPHARTEETPDPSTRASQKLGWGKVAGGLQVGLALPQWKRRYAAGALIPVVLYLRNSGKQDITFTYARDAEEMPMIFTDRGKQVLPHMPAAGGTFYPVATRTLKPREQMLLRRATLRLATDPERYPDVPTMEARPGRYTLSYSPSLTVLPISDSLLLLSSGKVRFEIVRGGAP